MTVPAVRIRAVNDAPVREDGRYVVYWMVAQRRLTMNFALDRALEHARDLGRPLLVFEPLRAGYEYASDRIHRFVMDGMEDHAARLAGVEGVRYHRYLEPSPGDGKGLLEAIAADAGAVVTDEWPSFFVPRMVAAAGERLPVRLEAVDGNGLLPLRSTERIFPTAYSFRGHLQKSLKPHLREFPVADPLRDLDLPAAAAPRREIRERWPSAERLEEIDVDRGVPPVARRGGPEAAQERLERFLAEGLPRYAEDRNRPEEEVTSGLSPWLHFGHISAHEVFSRIAEAEERSVDDLPDGGRGKRTGWWRMSEAAEAFLDQLVTWRELGFHTSLKLDGHDDYDSLPGFALTTLAEHEDDPREHVYGRDEFEAAATHDPLWNAAQIQLREEGVIHNYLRMLWGKKILEWSESPRAALDTMLHLNDRWAIDGRDPNSVSGIFWCLGRYDRAWGPERPIFGKVRYMTSKNTARKVRVSGYLERYGGDAG